MENIKVIDKKEHKKWFQPGPLQKRVQRQIDDFRDSLQREATDFLEQGYAPQNGMANRFQEVEIPVQDLTDSESIIRPPTGEVSRSKEKPSKEQLEIEQNTRTDSAGSRRSRNWNRKLKKKKVGTLSISEFEELIFT